jgi:hypothetical protein
MFKNYQLISDLTPNEKPWQVLIFAHQVAREVANSINPNIKRNCSGIKTRWNFTIGKIVLIDQN